MRTKNNRNIQIINIFLIIFFIITVFLPLTSMLLRITPDGFKSLINSEQFSSALLNSLFTTFVATIISIIMAFLAAWCIKRINIKYKSLFNAVFLVPMLIPSISHAFGLVSLLGTNGFFTKMFNLKTSIYGYTGIIIGSVMYSFPIAYLMFTNILQYENGVSYQAAKVLGIPRIWAFKDITLPYLKKTIIACFFSIFTMIITDYGVPVLIGGKVITISTLMYNKVVSMIDYDMGSCLGAFLLIPAIIAFVIDSINREMASNSFVDYPVEQNNNKISKLLGYLFCAFVCILVISPIISFIFMSFVNKYPIDTSLTIKHVLKTFKKGADGYLFNSIFYSVTAGVFGTIIAFISSYLTSRIKTKLSSFLHLLSLVTMAIPGIVLGLSYVITFHDSFIYGTIIVVVLANTIHFFSSPYLMMYNALSKVNDKLEEVGQTIGISRIRIVFDVIIPKVKTTLLEMFSYYFVNSMMTISAISFLSPPAPKAIALMINQFEAQLLMECAAFVSLIIFICNIIMKTVIYVLNKRIEKNDSIYNLQVND